MPVSAKFIADFESFKTAVDQSIVKLRDFESGANKVGPSLNRMVDQFSGRKLIQEATMMARVLGDAGSIARLTGNELQVAGAKAAEAAEKMKRMGVDVPPGLQRIADAATQAAAATKATADAAKGASASTGLLVTGIGALAGAFTLAKVVGFASDLVTAAGALQDFHERTDISIEGLQRFKVIAEQSGSSLDAVATAVFQMGRRFAGDDKSAAKAVAELGLSFTALRAMRPEDAFNEVGKALGALEDPMKRSQLGAAIFGRTVDELIPTLKHLSDETGAYVTLSAQQVRAIDAIGDAFVRAKASIVPLTVSVIDNTFQISKAYNAWSALLGKIDEAPKVMGSAKAALDAMNAGVSGRALQPVGGQDLDRIQREAIEQTNAAVAAQDKALAKAEAAAVKLAAANTAAAKALRDFHNAMGVQFIADMGDANKATEAAAAALRKFNNELGVQYIQDIERANKATEDVATAMRALSNELGVLDMEARAHEFAFVGPIQDGLIKQTQTWNQELHDLAGAMTQIAQVSGDSFGGIVKDLAQVIVAMDAAAKSAEAFKAAQVSGSKMGMATGAVGMAGSLWSATSHTGGNDGLGSMDTKSTAQNVLGGAMTGAAIGSVIPVLGTAAGFAIGAMVGLARSIKKVGEAEKEARKEVEQWTIAFGATLTQAQRLEAATAGWEGAATLVGVRDAFAAAGLSAAEAEAAVKRLWDATREGPAAAAEAQAAIDRVIGSNTAALDAIHGMGLYTTAELQAVADSAKAVFEYMERAGTYTAEQLAIAWDEMAAAMRRANGDQSQVLADTAKAAGYQTIQDLMDIADQAQDTYDYMRQSGLYAYAELERAEQAAAKATAESLGLAYEAVESLSSRYKSLSDSVSKEAPEKIMGSIEKAARAEMAALESQMNAQAKSIESDAKAAAAALEKELASIDPAPVHVQIVWDVPRLPFRSGGGEAPERTPGEGGGGTAVLQVDGRTLAEVVVPHIPGAVRRYGL